MKRGQLSIEFFLIVAFILGLASALLTVSEDQVRQTTLLDRAALARNALDTVTHAANQVWLSGNGTRIVAEVFVPVNSICLLYNSTQQRLYCDVAVRCPNNPSQFCYTYGERLVTSQVIIDPATCPPYNALTGWYSIQLSHNGTAVNAVCTRLS